jgi:cyclophilin family peptidyl-prolyl cis-trans isomerase
MLRLLVLPALLLTLAAGGCGKDDDKEPATTTETSATTTEAQEKDAVGCVVVDKPEPRGPGDEKKPALELDAGEDYEVTIKTNCGEIVIALDVERAPKTAASFAALADSGFYEGLTFHRVLADFVIQGGDPLGNGTGGPGYNVVEKPPSDLVYKRGIVAMAKSQVDPSGASGSQFFVVTAQDAGLPPQYALVGKVKSGMGTVNRIAAQPVDGPQGVPLSPVVIETAAVDPPIDG